MKEPLYEVRHEGPFTPMFEDREIILGVGGLSLAVDQYEIFKPRRAWVREPSHRVEREIPDALAGVVYGHGRVLLSRTRAAIDVDGDERAIVPHGLFEVLTDEERTACPGAEWKFSFDYTEAPTVHPM